LDVQQEFVLASLIDKYLVASHKTLLAKGILRMRLLSRKQSVSTISTAMTNLSKGNRATVWKAEAKPTSTRGWISLNLGSSGYFIRKQRWCLFNLG